MEQKNVGTYVGEGKSYEDVKLRILTAVLSTMGIEVKDEGHTTKLIKDGEVVASFEIGVESPYV